VTAGWNLKHMQIEKKKKRYTFVVICDVPNGVAVVVT
jgi:hypothetical protein